MPEIVLAQPGQTRIFTTTQAPEDVRPYVNPQTRQIGEGAPRNVGDYLSPEGFVQVRQVSESKTFDFGGEQFTITGFPQDVEEKRKQLATAYNEQKQRESNAAIAGRSVQEVYPLSPAQGQWQQQLESGYRERVETVGETMRARELERISLVPQKEIIGGKEVVGTQEELQKKRLEQKNVSVLPVQDYYFRKSTGETVLVHGTQSDIANFANKNPNAVSIPKPVLQQKTIPKNLVGGTIYLKGVSGSPPSLASLGIDFGLPETSLMRLLKTPREPSGTDVSVSKPSEKQQIVSTLPSAIQINPDPQTLLRVNILDFFGLSQAQKEKVISGAELGLVGASFVLPFLPKSVSSESSAVVEKASVPFLKNLSYSLFSKNIYEPGLITRGISGIVGTGTKIYGGAKTIPIAGNVLSTFEKAPGASTIAGWGLTLGATYAGIEGLKQTAPENVKTFIESPKGQQVFVGMETAQQEGSQKRGIISDLIYSSLPFRAVPKVVPGIGEVGYSQRQDVDAYLKSQNLPKDVEAWYKDYYRKSGAIEAGGTIASQAVTELGTGITIVGKLSTKAAQEAASKGLVPSLKFVSKETIVPFAGFIAGEAAVTQAEMDISRQTPFEPWNYAKAVGMSVALGTPLGLLVSGAGLSAMYGKVGKKVLSTAEKEGITFLEEIPGKSIEKGGVVFSKSAPKSFVPDITKNFSSRTGSDLLAKGSYYLGGGIADPVEVFIADPFADVFRKVGTKPKVHVPSLSISTGANVSQSISGSVQPSIPGISPNGSLSIGTLNVSPSVSWAPSSNWTSQPSSPLPSLTETPPQPTPPEPTPPTPTPPEPTPPAPTPPSPTDVLGLTQSSTENNTFSFTDTFSQTFTVTPSPTPTLTPRGGLFILPFFGDSSFGGKQKKTQSTRFIDEFTLAFAGLASPGTPVYFGHGKKASSIAATRKAFAPKKAKKRKGQKFKRGDLIGFNPNRFRSFYV